MAEDFLSRHVRVTLSFMQDKILDIYDMGCGWEVWAQVELALEERQALSKPQSNYTTPNFERERSVYRRSRKRCDFVTEFSTKDGKKHRHFVEFKCLNKANTPDAFANLVKKDYDKIMGAKVKKKWSKDVHYLAGWVGER